MKNRKILYIDAFGTDEKVRGKGLGKKMMMHVFKYAKEIDCESIELGVSSSNIGAIGFYENLGMVEKSKTLEIKL